MTLSTLLSSNVPYNTQPNPMQASGIDRTEWSGGGWKGGKGSKSALSALTLLAFLFFLNILQNCLKDTINTTPTMMVMVMPTTEATARRKRELSPEDFNNKIIASVPENYNWSYMQITNLVHDQVELYWSSSDTKSRHANNNHSKFKDSININNKLYDPPNSQNQDLNHTSKKLKISDKGQYKKRHGIIIKNNNGSSYKEHLQQSIEKDIIKLSKSEYQQTIWAKILGNLIRGWWKNAKERMCCNLMVCQAKEIQRQAESYDSQTSQSVRQSVSSICNDHSPDKCNYKSQQCQNSFARTLINVVTSFMTVS